jgi:hypothetical protein
MTTWPSTLRRRLRRAVTAFCDWRASLRGMPDAACGAGSEASRRRVDAQRRFWEAVREGRRLADARCAAAEATRRGLPARR